PALAGAVWLSLPTPSAEARPQYFEQFNKTYPTLAKAAESQKCGVCHGMGSKKERNHYGKAIVGALGESKNVKELKEVEKAIKAAESKESSTKGKTFGDLIKEGKLPE